MKLSKTILTLLFMGFLAGCGKSSTGSKATEAQPALPAAPPPAETPPPPAPPPITAAPQPVADNSANPPPQMVRASQNVALMTPELNDYTFMQKSEYIQKMTAARDDLNLKLSQVTDKIDHASDAVQREERSKVGTLQTQINLLDAKLDQVNISTEANWDKAKAEAQGAYDDARQALEDESQRLDQQLN